MLKLKKAKQLKLPTKVHVFDYWLRGKGPKYSYRNIDSISIGRLSGQCISIEFKGGTSAEAWLAAKAVRENHPDLKGRTIVKFR
jgi:hypothetical protein